MTKIVRFVAFVAFVAFANHPAVAGSGEYTNIDSAEVRAMIDKGVKVIDVRRVEEWRKTGVIEGAALITAFDSRGRFNPDFRAALAAAVEPDEDVVLICRTGGRSRVISELLIERAGYTHIYNATGGMMSWIADGNPVAPCPNC